MSKFKSITLIQEHQRHQKDHRVEIKTLTERLVLWNGFEGFGFFVEDLELKDLEVLVYLFSRIWNGIDFHYLYKKSLKIN